ncbi:MAG: hypothetical protein RBJ76_14615 [Stenomitos frigidus ULC029]
MIQAFFKAAAKILLVFALLAMYLFVCLMLLADSFPPLWVLLFITLHVLYSWSAIWFYAKLKARDEKLLVLLLPVLATTSVLGIVFWVVFQPEAKIRRHQQAKARLNSLD